MKPENLKVVVKDNTSAKLTVAKDRAELKLTNDTLIHRQRLIDLSMKIIKELWLNMFSTYRGVFEEYQGKFYISMGNGKHREFNVVRYKED